MVKTSLVGPDVEFGSNVLELLDAGGFPYSVACWLQSEEEFGSEWVLVLGSPLYEKLGPKRAYLRLIEVLRPLTARSVFQIRILGNRNPLVKSMRKAFGKTASVEGMRLGGQGMGGVWIDDGYVYRIR